MSDDKRYTLDEAKTVLGRAGAVADDLSMLMHRHFGEIQGHNLFGGKPPAFPFFEAMGLADKVARNLDTVRWMIYRLDNGSSDV